MAQTPAGFLFTVKASRYLTHIKRLTDIEQPIKRFYEPLRAADRRRASGAGAVAAARELPS